MKLIYYLRVFLFSVEMLILLGGVLINDYSSNLFQGLANLITIRESLAEYLMLAPLGIAVWIFVEIRSLLQEDNRTTNILIGWGDYWKLKVHTSVAISYAIIFGLISLVPWCTEFSIKSGIGFLLFVISLLGQLCVALSIYNARIRLKEIIAVLS